MMGSKTLRSSLRGLLVPLVGNKLIGAVEYVLFPSRRAAWGGPFNGQRNRQTLFRELMDAIVPVAIVETGTYRGTTAAFMASTGIPVHTIEVDDRRYGFSRARFWHGKVRVWHGDSRSALRAIFDGPLRNQVSAPIFVYLDAHWQSDLPLAEELEIVFGNCPSAVVMIDDFQVPWDEGFGFDDYGHGKVLSRLLIAASCEAYGLCIYFPATPSTGETGARRGCVVLAKSECHGAILQSMSLLRSA